MISLTLVDAYRAMADLTAPECASSCLVPHSCCDPMYCALAEEWAKDEGIILAHTSHPTLPFMGTDGCTVAPHLRPLCTLHTCAINSHGFKPGDDVWTKKYFRLRELIDNEEFKRSPFSKESIG